MRQKSITCAAEKASFRLKNFKPAPTIEITFAAYDQINMNAYS